MRTGKSMWWRLLLVLPLSQYAFGVSGCMADVLRGVAEGLNDAANEVEDDNSSSLQGILDDIESWFD